MTLWLIVREEDVIKNNWKIQKRKGQTPVKKIRIGRVEVQHDLQNSFVVNKELSEKLRRCQVKVFHAAL